MNVLTHTNKVNIEDWQRESINKLKKTYDKEDSLELYHEAEAGNPKIESKQGNGRDSLDIDSETETVLGGAVWDIFRREDVPKLIEYVRKHEKEFRHINNELVDSVSSIASHCLLYYATYRWRAESLLICWFQVIHPIHDQTIFLNARHKIQLKKEFSKFLTLFSRFKLG